MNLGRARTASATITRPNDTTAYAIGDVIAATGAGGASQFAGLGDGGLFRIDRAELMIEAAALIASEAAYRLYLFNALPTVIADNAAFDIAAADRNAFAGYIDFTTPLDLGATLFSQANGLNMPVKSGSVGFYAYLTTMAAYTPTALRVHRLKLFGTVI